MQKFQINLASIGVHPLCGCLMLLETSAALTQSMHSKKSKSNYGFSWSASTVWMLNAFGNKCSIDTVNALQESQKQILASLGVHPQ